MRANPILGVVVTLLCGVRHPTTLAFSILLHSMFYETPCFAQFCPRPSFADALTFPAGNTPFAVAVGDFNGDGKADLAVGNAAGCQFGTLSVLLGNGDGTFQTAVNYDVGGCADGVAVGDFNGDGKPDVAVGDASSGSSTISVFLGNGDGTLQSPLQYPAGASPSSVAAGEFNGDGKLDLVLGSNGSDGFSVLLGNGDGSFQTPVNYATGGSCYGVAVGDFNGDGKLDLAVDNSNFLGTVSVLLGNGDGTFRAAVNYPVGAVPRSLAVGDFNGDGKPDLVVANASSDNVSVLLGKGDGTFQPAVNYGVGAGSHPRSVAVEDFNGDGKADLAVAISGSSDVWILLGNGDGTFQPGVSFYVGTRPDSLALGDFNGDGSPDLAVAVSDNDPATGYVSVLLNTCPAAGPSLAIVRRNATVRISWPIPSKGFVLESTPSLAHLDWRPAVETPVTNEDQLVVTAPVAQSERYFRLHKP